MQKRNLKQLEQELSLLTNPRNKKTTKVKFYGGFHQMDPIIIHINIPPDKFDAELSKIATFKPYIWELLSINQTKKVQNHLCGITDCKCGLRDFEIAILD